MKYPFFKASLPPAVRMAVLGLAVLLPVAAQAGFEWRGPIAPEVPAAAVPPPLPVLSEPEAAALAPVISPGAPPAAAAPVAPVVTGNIDSAPRLEGAIVSQDPVSLVPVRRMMPPPNLGAPVNLSEKIPHLAQVEPPAAVQKPDLAPLPDVPDASPMNKPEAPLLEEGEAALVDGFGKNMPLAMAVTQILPSGYSVSFGPGVSPGAKVSWSGGKPWRQVLSDVLAPQRLAFRVAEGAIFIFRAGKKGGVVPPPPLPMPPRVVSPSENLAAVQSPTLMSSEEPLPLLEPQPLMIPDPVPAPVANANEEAAPKAVSAAPAASLWRAEGGQMLRAVLTEWSRREGVELYWATDYDYRIPYPTVLSGSYPEVVRDLIAQFSSLNPRPYARLHEAPGGARVLAVRSEDLVDFQP